MGEDVGAELLTVRGAYAGVMANLCRLVADGMRLFKSRAAQKKRRRRERGKSDKQQLSTPWVNA